MSRRLAVGLVAVMLSVSCAGDRGTSPEGRAVSIETTACGHASRTSGSGVIVEDEWVIASAHVVIGAGSVTVEGAFGSEVATIVAVDVDADVALLRVPTAQATAIRLASAEAGDVATLHGGGEPISTEIERRVEVRIEAVRSTRRTSRLGYEVDVRVELGDSGGGAYNADGDLVGLIFGRDPDSSPRSFVVGREALDVMLAGDRSGVWECDVDQHRIVAIRG